MRFAKNHSYKVRKSHTYRAHSVKAKANPDAAQGTDESQSGEDEQEESAQASEPTAPPAKTFTQEQVNAILAKEKKKREEADAKAKREADQKALADKEEFKTLADQRKSELDSVAAEQEKSAAELEEAQAVVERYEAALKSYADAAKKGLDKGVLALLDKLPVDEQLAWIAENAKAENRSGAIPPPTPRGDQSSQSKEIDQERKKRTSRMYRSSF